ncbi:hypothetical protein [Pseudobacteriovorax antillogorgiicola]|uniref:Uncharacterized protein n=1 Tax=Pseudobacteriovorax antillogorgiicola TaxID=1513793 RepID=A0A1Y6CB39_9BACT|nr:hypothetical protein [Pseudobacteriovorax antillogorgiicola]TCS49447.1 hypothetical protein EDD56_115129 [Pseudobacteriovorax antillogorgiicola]SMF46495.1 hypothetical protein SAMN06296036_11456 [Pseudobacteriovorax antillogorgiicola]
MKLVFEHHYQQKYLEISFEEPLTIRSSDDIMELRQQWLAGLSSWHSPYKAIINGEGIRVDPDSNHQEIQDALERMAKLLSGFFLKKAVIYGLPNDDQALFPFEPAADKDEAYKLAGVRDTGPKVATDFRSAITLQNHFKQHVMELSFEAPVHIDSKDKVMALRSKITNNLMQWHSAWNLLIDCSKLEFSQDMEEEFNSMIRFFKGFFLKEILGYTPKEKGLFYPFKVYRSRHAAAGRLESEGHFSGEDANCQSRK